MKKKIFIALIFTISFPLNIFATSIGELTDEQDKIKQNISEVTDKIMDYEEEIQEIQETVDKNNENIEKLEKQKKENEKKIEEYRDELNSTLRLMQRMNNTNVLVTYFYDENTLDNNYFLKLDNINKIFTAITNDVSTFVREVEESQKDIAKIEEIKTKNEKEIKKVDKKLKEQEKLETSLKQELAEIETKIGKIALTTTASASSSDKNSIMKAAGISESDYAYVDYIITKESGWNATASNPYSGAYGLCQALPGSKMASAGSDWQVNPVTQLEWCNSYAQGRYGSWSAAYSFWISNHWW